MVDRPGPGPWPSYRGDRGHQVRPPCTDLRRSLPHSMEKEESARLCGEPAQGSALRPVSRDLLAPCSGLPGCPLSRCPAVPAWLLALASPAVPSPSVPQYLRGSSPWPPRLASLPALPSLP